jgi:beta-glucosidase
MTSSYPSILPAAGASCAFLATVFAALGCIGVKPGPSAGQIAASRASVPTPDIEELLGKMTLDEKIGQMTQIDWKLAKNTDDVRKLCVGSVLNGASSLPEPNTPQNWVKQVTSMQTRALSTRLGIPIFWGTDAVHGNALVRGATMFPHNIGMGCTRNPELDGLRPWRFWRRAFLGPSPLALPCLATSAGAAPTRVLARHPSWPR